MRGGKDEAPTVSCVHRKGRFVSQDINVLALVKGKERYIFLFDDDHRAELLRTLGRFASDPELSFTWFDAAVLSHRVRHAFGPIPPASRKADRSYSIDAVDELD